MAAARKNWNVEIESLRTRADEVIARIHGVTDSTESTKIANLASNLRLRADRLEARRDAYAMRSIRMAHR